MVESNANGLVKKPSLFQRLKESAQRLKVETYALYLACLDQRTPWYAKAWALLVVAYTFSPIDLIPDFIPLLGYLDDLIIVPLGIWLAMKMIPPAVLMDARQKARDNLAVDSKVGRWGTVIIILIWLAALTFLVIFILRLIHR